MKSKYLRLQAIVDGLNYITQKDMDPNQVVVKGKIGQTDKHIT